MKRSLAFRVGGTTLNVAAAELTATAISVAGYRARVRAAATPDEIVGEEWRTMLADFHADSSMVPATIELVVSLRERVPGLTWLQLLDALARMESVALNLPTMPLDQLQATYAA